jgi:hypothetical protein
MTLRSGRTLPMPTGDRMVRAQPSSPKCLPPHWPGQDPIGKRIRYNNGGDIKAADRRWYKVVGVIADVKDYGLDQPARPSVYLRLLSTG